MIYVERFGNLFFQESKKWMGKNYENNEIHKYLTEVQYHI